MRFPASSLGLLEANSISGGVRATDEVLKTAAVSLVRAAPISPGKFLILITGGVAEVEASMAAGRAALGGSLVDEITLARVHEQVAPALGSGVSPAIEAGAAIGVVETLSVASTIIGADAAAKAARIRLIEIAPGRGIGGKGFFTMTGDVAAVEAAATAARAPIEVRGYHLRTEVLAGPHPVLAERVARRLLGSFEEEEGETE